MNVQDFIIDIMSDLDLRAAILSSFILFHTHTVQSLMIIVPTVHVEITANAAVSVSDDTRVDV